MMAVRPRKKNGDTVTEDLPDTLDGADPAIDTAAESAATAVRDAAPRHTRRLSDKVLISFHQACDQSDFEVAVRLLNVLEFMLTRRDVPADTGRRRNLDSLVAAYERLWHLKHPDIT